MPVRFGSILHLNNSASEATLDANNLRGTTVQIDKFDSASLATIGVGLTTAPGKRRLGTIVATTGSADAGVKYYAFIQTSSGDTLLSGSEWTTLTNWKQIQVDATTIDTSSFVLNSATSSFILESQTSSFVNNSATSSFVLNSATSSFVNNSATSSFVLNSATSSFVNNSATSSFILESQTGSFVLESETGSFLLNTTDTFEGLLTLSGNLSVTGDGNITASNGTFEGGIIRANTDSENYIKGSLSFKGGATAYRAATIARGGASGGDTGGDVETADLVISTNNFNNFFIFKGNTGTGGGALIISGARSPESGSPSLDVRGPISASGNISSSGDIIATNVSASELRISNPSHTGNLRFFQDSNNSYQLTSNIGTIFDFGSTNVITTSQRIDGTRGMTIKTHLGSDLIKFRDFDSNDIIIVDHSGSLTLGNASGHEPHVIINTNVTASGDISASGDIFANNIRAVGDVIAQRYIVSSSVSHITQSFSSGSTIFGDTSNDTHQFTGSLSITGSSITSERTPLVITAGGEVQVADADFIVAGEFVANSATSSFVNNSATSSFVNNSATSSFVNNSATSSFVFNSSTGSFVLESETGSFALTSNVVANTSTGSFVLESETGSFIITASATNNVITFTEGDGGTFTVTVDTGSSTTITGTNKQVLFFDGDDNPAGDSGLTYNKSSDTLFISGNIEHAGDANTGIFFGSDTITLKGNNAQIAKFDTSKIIFNENVGAEFDGLFLSGGLHDWGKNNDVDATSGFRVVSDRAFTHVTPQFTRARHALVGSIIRDPNVMNLASFPLNYLVYGKAGVTINGGSNDTDPDVTTPVDPKIAGGKDNVGIPVVQIAGDLEIRPTQSMDGGGTTPGIRIAAGDSSGSVDPGIFFYNRDNISNDSSSFFYSSASAEIRFDTASQSVKFFAGSTTEDLKEVLHISKSGDNPRIGIGTNNPIRAFDFKEVRDDNRGGEILIRGSRSTKGAENNDEVGRINFAIDSSSFEKVDTSGSAAEIVAIVDDIDPTGVEGSLSLRVASAKTAGSVQRIKLIGNPNSPAVEITGSTEFDTDVTIGDDLTVSDFALLNSARIGSTATDPGDGVLHVEDYGVFVGGLKIGSSEDPGANNLIVDGTTTLKGITNIGNATGDTLVVSASNVDFPSVANKSNASTTDNILILDGDRVKKTPQSGLPYISIQDGVVPGGNSNQLLMFSGSTGTKKVKTAPGVTHSTTNGYVFSGAGTNFDILVDKGFIISTTVGSLTASANISASGTVQATTLDASTFGSTLSSNISGAFTSTSASLATRLATAESELDNTLLSSSAQIASDVSGAFDSASNALVSNVATNTNHIGDLTAATSSYVNNSSTSSFVFNSSTGSFAIAADVSGAFTSTSSSLASRLATAESELDNTLISSSAQIASNISGAFTSTSASLASKTLFTTITTSGNVSASGNLIGNEITASGNVDIGGILSIPGFSSVSASLASAVAGGDNLGNHTATQDLDLDGNSIKDALHITASGNISASGTIVGSNLSGTNTGDQDLSGFLSSSAQIASSISGAFTSTSASLASNIATNIDHISDLTVATSSYVNNSATSSFVFNSSTGSFAIAADVSGAFTSTSSSLSTRLATAESELGNTLISSSAQIASDISGAFNVSSASLAGNIATNTDHISDLTSVTGSYVNNSATSSFVFNSSTGSFAIAADISGAFDADSSSLATRLATAESELGNTLLSSSAQISTDISGAFTSTSASLAADIVTNAGNIGTTTNALTVDNATLQLNSGTTFNGSAARTISIKDGGVDSDALAANIAVTQLTASAISASGTVTANSFTGNGLSIDGSSNSHIEVGTYNVGFDTAGINTLFITGSGLIVSGAMADANHHNMVKIGNVELIDLNSAVSTNEFLIHNVNSLKITSGSDGGDIANDDGRLFEHNGTNFTLYRNNSSVINAAANGTITFNGTNISFVASSDTFMKAPNSSPGASSHIIFSTSDPNSTPGELNSINFDSAFPFLGGAITASAVSASGTIVGSNLSGTNTGDQDLSGFLSSSAQIASNISGAFTSTSSSLAADIVTNAGNIGTTTNALTVDNATLQLNSGTTFNGSAARTISIKDGGVDSDALADDITVAGTLTVAADIQHSGDTDTKIAFSTDVVSIKAGNTSVFTSSPTGSVLPNVHQNIFDTGSLALNANSAFGDIIKMGDTNTTAGGLYYLKNNGTWALAQANAAATSTGSLAVAVGTNSTTDGMCLRGLMNPFTDPGAGIGSPVYISDTHPGRILATAPSSTGDVVRIVGHQFGTDLIYFNPSNDFIVHA